MKKLLLFSIVLFSSSLFMTASAQCDTIATLCGKHMTSDYISDGQQYRALLRGEEIAEFEMTLYGGSRYRISACSGFQDGKLVFSILDQDRNLLFANNEYDMSPYWDFELDSTVDCIIEAKLKPGDAESGCAVLLVSFLQ